MRRPVRALILALIVTTTGLLSRPAWADLAPSGVSAEGVSTRDADMKTVSKALESKVLRERLMAMGLDEKETERRLSKLSDQDIHQMATRIEAVQPGGFVVEVLVIVVLALLAVYLFKRV